jgi:two-component system phosphate regulon sensor histidine kinase PhoR
MRHSLFVRFLFLAFFIIFSFFIITKPVFLIFKDGQNNPLLIYLVFSTFLSLILAALFSTSIKQVVKRLLDHLNQTGDVFNPPQIIRGLPDEISQLYDGYLKYISIQKVNYASSLADQRLFASILENMTDGILIADQRGFVVLINKAAKDMFSIKGEDAVGKSIIEVFRHYRVHEIWERCKQSGQQEMATLETAPDKAYIQCIAAPLDKGLSGNILILFQDLTRIHQLEIVRQDFVSNVSHELRTPLASLKLITETLQDSALEDPSSAAHFLTRMDAELDNLTQMVEELLELSRIESGQVPLQKKLIAPCEIVRNAGGRMALQAERAGIIIDFTCEKEMPMILADGPRLEQVLVNLIHNAIKFTPPGGRVDVSAYPEDDGVTFFVKDTGKGISPKDQERIFERFYKTDRSRTDKGTGLGLSISRHLVEAHHGKIWLVSIPQQGSTFFFRIPIH